MDFDTTTIVGALAALAAAIAGIVQAGKFFSRFTDTTKDDEFFAKAEEVIEGLKPEDEAGRE